MPMNLMQTQTNYRTNYRQAPQAANDDICDWNCLSAQLLDQWKRITREELEETGHTRQGIARLIECKYGIHFRLVENYLSNLERTLPILT